MNIASLSLQSLRVQDSRPNEANGESVTNKPSMRDTARQSVEDSQQRKREKALGSLYEVLLKPKLRGGGRNGKRALHEMVGDDDHNQQRRTDVTAPPSLPLPVTMASTTVPTIPSETTTTVTSLPNLPVTTTTSPSLVLESTASAATASPSLPDSNNPVISQAASTTGPELLTTEMSTTLSNPQNSTEPPLASGTGIMDRTNQPINNSLAPDETEVPSAASASCKTLACKVVAVLNDHPNLYVVLIFVIVSFCCCLRWKLCRKPQRDPRGEYRAVGRMLASNFDTELSDDEIHYTYDDVSGDESDAIGGTGGWSTARGKGSIELRNIGQDGRLPLEEMNG